MSKKRCVTNCTIQLNPASKWVNNIPTVNHRVILYEINGYAEKILKNWFLNLIMWLLQIQMIQEVDVGRYPGIR